MSIWKTLKSFRYAINGILAGIEGNNMRAHIFAGVVVVLVGLALKLTAHEWTAVILAIGAVTSAELMNTAVEEVCNVVRDHLGASYESTKLARDMAAGAVLITALAAAAVAVIIYGPKLVLIFFPA